MKNKQVEYYERRALEYEKIYQKLERQDDQEKIKKYLPQVSKAKSVLEIGCGTGYWTQYISEGAKSILASDINPSMLELAQKKKYHCPISFSKLDYESLSETALSFDLVCAAFVISHIKKEELTNFLFSLIVRLNGGGEIIFIDNLFVEGNSTPIFKSDNFGNTYQKRKLEDGSEYEVLKNYFSDEEWEKALSNVGKFHLIKWEYFYALHIRIN